MTLLEFIALFHSSSKKEIKRLIENNSCKLNGVIERIASQKVAYGDSVEWNPQIKEKVHFDKKRILFEDDALLIYNKPSGITSDAEGILELLKPHGHFFLVHRLDKETSGILILAKNEEEKKALTNAFRDRAIKKQYVALVEGIPKQKGIIENYLGKVGGFQGQTLYGAVGKVKGKLAKTEWVLQKALKHAALISCFPETGRTHQIRVHLSEMGHPILGDYQYGKPKQPHRLMLHAYKISFNHQGKILSITAPIPKDFQDVLHSLT